MTNTAAHARDALEERVARAIAKHGVGRPWDDFNELDAFDIDQHDLLEYARAAIAAMPDEGLRKALEQAEAELRNQMYGGGSCDSAGFVWAKVRAALSGESHP